MWLGLPAGWRQVRRRTWSGRRRVALRSATVLLAVACLVIAGCADWSVGPDPVPFYSLRYIVTGTAESADVTIRCGEGTLELYECAELPWVLEFTGTFNGCPYLSAESCSEAGDVYLRIYVNGRLVDSASGDPPYASAEAGTR